MRLIFVLTVTCLWQGMLSSCLSAQESSAHSNRPLDDDYRVVLSSQRGEWMGYCEMTWKDGETRLVPVTAQYVFDEEDQKVTAYLSYQLSKKPFDLEMNFNLDQSVGSDRVFSQVDIPWADGVPFPCQFRVTGDDTQVMIAEHLSEDTSVASLTAFGVLFDDHDAQQQVLIFQLPESGNGLEKISTYLRKIEEDSSWYLFEIKSEPPGATVYIDGKELGATTQLKYYNKDRIKVRIVLDGHEAVEEEIELKKCKLTSRKFELDASK